MHHSRRSFLTGNFANVVSPETAVPPEHHIAYEFGDHGLDSDQKAAANAILAGDLSANTWDQGLQSRIEQAQPQMLAIDSLPASIVQRHADGSLQLIDSDQVGLGLRNMLPGQPGNLPSDMLVMAGDHPQTAIALRPDAGQTDEPTQDRVPIITGLAGAIATYPVLAIIANQRSRPANTRKQNSLHEHHHGPEPLSRRKFSKALGFAALVSFITSAAMVTEAGMHAASLSPDQTLSGLGDAYLDKTSFLPRVDAQASQLSQGRNALVHAKMQDSLERRQTDRGIIAWGRSHAYDRSEIADDTENMNNAIRQYAQLTFDTEKRRMFAEGKEVRIQDLAEKVINDLAEVSLLSMQEPDPEAIASDGMQEALNSAVIPVDHFYSPRVLHALEGWQPDA